MVRERSWLAWLAAVLIAIGCGRILADEQMAEIVPKADDLSLKLSIENIDGKVVNVPETHIRQIPPGEHYLGIKIEFREMSAGSFLSGLGAFTAIAGAVTDKPPVHEGLSFTALPGHRYLVNGAMEDGKPKVWIDVEYSKSNPDDDRR